MYMCTENGEHISKEVLKRALPYAERAGAVDILGGEPSLSPAFPGAIKTIASKVHAMRLVTNGSWIRGEFANDCQEKAGGHSV